MSADVIVAGHVCLDIIPAFQSGNIALRPGHLVEVGRARFAPGGAISNVGLALAKLDTSLQLIGRIGDDAFGAILQRQLRKRAPEIDCVFEVVPEASTSYTIVISPPEVDRIFLHHAGCNDHFAPSDLDAAVVADARIFYFGYPPAMRRTFTDGGSALAALLQDIKQDGATTALDLSMPGPNSEAGRADWLVFLERVLPHVDVFLPSLEETCFMLERKQFETGVTISPAFLSDLSERLLRFGAGLVGLKLGHKGLYLRTASAPRLERMGRAAPPDLARWAARELWAPVFQVNVRGTTGAGDTTLAGFIAALLRGTTIEEAANMAAAVGACCVEAVDATSGVLTWEATRTRIHRGWEHATNTVPAPRWQRDGQTGVFVGPRDRGGYA